MKGCLIVLVIHFFCCSGIKFVWVWQISFIVLVLLYLFECSFLSKYKIRLFDCSVNKIMDGPSFGGSGGGAYWMESYQGRHWRYHLIDNGRRYHIWHISMLSHKVLWIKYHFNLLLAFWRTKCYILDSLWNGERDETKRTTLNN